MMQEELRQSTGKTYGFAAALFVLIVKITCFPTLPFDSRHSARKYPQSALPKCRHSGKRPPSFRGSDILIYDSAITDRIFYLSDQPLPNEW